MKYFILFFSLLVVSVEASQLTRIINPVKGLITNSARKSRIITSIRFKSDNSNKYEEENKRLRQEIENLRLKNELELEKSGVKLKQKRADLLSTRLSNFTQVSLNALAWSVRLFGLKNPFGEE